MHRGLLLKANAKKMKKKQFIQKYDEESDNSNEDLTSDDEDEVSKGIVGEIFNNRYFCLKYLGRGTFSRVWMVYDLLENSYKAMKVQFPKYYKDSLHEIKVMNKINNTKNSDSRIVKLYDTFLIDKTNYMIYELLGISLLELFRENEDDSDIESLEELENIDNLEELDSRSIIPVDCVKRIIKDILCGLEEAHKKKIIHTDLKPENILLNIENPQVEDIKKKFSSKNPSDIYNKLITRHLPDDFYEQDKKKRKHTKKKAKTKALNEFKILFDLNKDEFNFNKDLNDIDIDYSKINAKIVDFGNGEFEDDLLQDEISLRCYRCPENILNEYYDVKSDIWVVGCICYELLTSEYLFDIDKNKKSIERNKEHLHQMFELLGKMPKNLTENSDFGDMYFDSKGRIFNNKKFDYVSINDILATEFNFSDKEADLIGDFLYKMLEYDPKKRYCATKCLAHEWLKNT